MYANIMVQVAAACVHLLSRLSARASKTNAMLKLRILRRADVCCHNFFNESQAGFLESVTGDVYSMAGSLGGTLLANEHLFVA